MPLPMSGAAVEWPVRSRLTCAAVVQPRQGACACTCTHRVCTCMACPACPAYLTLSSCCPCGCRAARARRGTLRRVATSLVGSVRASSKAPATQLRLSSLICVTCAEHVVSEMTYLRSCSAVSAWCFGGLSAFEALDRMRARFVKPMLAGQVYPACTMPAHTRRWGVTRAPCCAVVAFQAVSASAAIESKRAFFPQHGCARACVCGGGGG